MFVQPALDDGAKQVPDQGSHRHCRRPTKSDPCSRTQRPGTTGPRRQNHKPGQADQRGNDHNRNSLRCWGNGISGQRQSRANGKRRRRGRADRASAGENPARSSADFPSGLGVSVAAARCAADSRIRRRGRYRGCGGAAGGTVIHQSGNGRDWIGCLRQPVSLRSARAAFSSTGRGMGGTGFEPVKA